MGKFRQISANFGKFRPFRKISANFGELERELGEPGSGAGGTRAPSYARPNFGGGVAGGTGGDRGLDPASKNKSKNPSKPSLVREKYIIRITLH